MKRFTLRRLTETDTATFGHLVDESETLVCRTLELPWKANATDVSRIPSGDYTAHRIPPRKRPYEVFMFDNVPGRDAIELHIGNRPRDTDGCILLGLEFGLVNGEQGVTDSRQAFVKFMGLLAGETNCLITVSDPAPLIA